MFSREQIDQVRSSADIVSTIRDYVPSLQISGRSVKGLCPFHSERTPSFHVHPEKGVFKCFGCGEAGDVIAFVSKIEGLSFSEALEKLAGQLGIPLKREKSSHAREPESARQQILRALEAAKGLYKEQLWQARTGDAARAYLRQRRITDETAQRFELGVAPSSGDSIFEALVKKGYSIEICQQAGLVARSNQGRYYDPLFGRLIFPIVDMFGHVVGFGGRVLPLSRKPMFQEETRDEGPKYINSPETPVFSKGKLLYGLNHAKNTVLSSKKVMILEGYMDVIGTHQAGVTYGVATLGTALTRDHAKLLKRYTTDVVCFFDADQAGQKAAVRGLEPLLQEDMFPRLVLTDETADPDELINEKGVRFFEDLVCAAPDFVDYILDRAGRRGALGLQEKASLGGQLLKLIGCSPNEILKGEWTKRVASRLGLNLEALQKEQAKQSAPRPWEKTATPAVSNKPKERYIPSIEEEYIQLLIHVPTTFEETGLAEEDFLDKRIQTLLGLIHNQIRSKGAVSIPALLDDAKDLDREWLMRLLFEEKDFVDPFERKEHLVKSIKLNKERNRLTLLSQTVAAGRATDSEREEYKDLLKKVKGSSRLVAS